MIQAKLQVGSADDAAEREADAVATEVLASLRSQSSDVDRDRPTDQRAMTGVSTPSASRIRRASAAANDPVVGREGGVIDGDVAAGVLHPGGGVALESRIRPRLEGAFGTSFDSVRIHRESKIAPQLGARAFTYGSDVHFAPGEYRPATDDGMRVLSHELTHVVQQTGAVGSVGARASRIARSTAHVQRDLGSSSRRRTS